MSININSEASCRRAYLNYHCYGNSMGITAEEMGEITQAWKDKLTSWQKCASNDENEYEFDDSEWRTSLKNGADKAKEESGFDGNTTKMKARGGSTNALSVLGTGAALTSAGLGVKAGSQFLKPVVGKAAEKAATEAAKKAGEKAAEKAVEKGLEKGAQEAAQKSAEEGVKNASKGAKIGAYIGAEIAIATAAAYFAKKPNKTEKEACDALQNTMIESQGALAEQQSEMESMAGELIDLSDEANDYNEEANDNIEDQKTEYDSYLQTYLELKEKAESGEPLTQEEKDLFKEVVGYLTEIGVEITETQEDTTDTVQDIYDDMETYQEGYDYAAETMGEIQGVTDFAEGFDTTTQTMCYVEGAAQTLNAASGIKAGVQAGLAGAASMGFNAWAWACAAMGAAAGVMSGIGTAEQFKWAGEVGTEIGMRKDTQTLNTDTQDIYDEEIDAYDGLMTGVEDLELEIPDDIEPPEDTDIPGQDSPAPDGTPDPLDPTKNEKKPKPEDEG